MNRKIKHFLIFTSILVLELFLPLHSAQAIVPLIPIAIGLGAIIVGGLAAKFAGQIMFASIANIVIAFIVLLLQLPLLAVNVILDISVVILGWATSPGFMKLSYTNPAGNLILLRGWTLTRDLANMGFVVGLVAIALSTALRVGEYQAKKTLPLLIGIALLINFTPAICGVIVDASNIMTQWLLGNIVNFKPISEIIGNQLNLVVEGVKKISSANINSDLLGRTIVLIVFGGVAAFVFLLYAMLFIFRYIAIWILVILSPLAFFAYIFPSTRGYWKKWWNQFIQWSFIGTIAAFWLYLSSHLIELAYKQELIGLGLPGGTTENLAGAINVLLPYVIPIVFLVFGFTSSLTTTASGSALLINRVDKGSKKLWQWGKEQAGARASSAVRERLAGSENVQRISQRMAQVSTPGTTRGGILGRIERTATGGIAGGIRRVGRAGLSVSEIEKKHIQKSEEESKKHDVPIVVSKFKGARTVAEKIGYLNRLIKEGDIDDAIYSPSNPQGIRFEEIAKVLGDAKKYDSHKDIVGALPILEDAGLRNSAGLPSATVLPLAAMTAPQKTQLAQAYSNEIISKIKPARAKQISNQMLTNPVIMESIVRSWDGRHIGPLVDATGITGIQSIERAITTLHGTHPVATIPATEHIKWLADPAGGNNPVLAKYIKLGAGRGLFTLT